MNKNQKVISLVSLAHFYSHFFFFIFPPLFPLLKSDLSVSYIELGGIIILFNLISALTQLPMGILVDRLDAPKLLSFAVFVQAISLIIISLFPSYFMIMFMMIPCGIANAIYHPADYTILNRSVTLGVMGRAFSIHTVMGFTGSAVAPLTMVYLSQNGGWENSLMIIGFIGVIISIIIVINISLLSKSIEFDLNNNGDQINNINIANTLRLLVTFPILMGFFFWFFNSFAHTGISYFSVSAFNKLYDMSLSQANLCLTIFLASTSIGILLGGILSDKTGKNITIAIIGNLFSGISIALIAVSGSGIYIILFFMSLAGFMSGITAPSRDLLVRSVAPKESIGAVFGFVSTGLNVGGIFAPFMYGWVLDFKSAVLVFLIAGICQVLIITTVLGLINHSSQQNNLKS